MIKKLQQNIPRLKIQESKWVLQLLSLISGILLWSYVLNTTTVEEDKMIKLKVILPPELALKEEIPDLVTFTFQGPRGFVRSLKRRDDLFVVDLNLLNIKKEGLTEIDLKSVAYDDLPFSVELVKITPAKIKLNLEHNLTRKIPLEIITTGELPRGHELKSMEVNPAKMTIWGPRSIVSKIVRIETSPFDLAQLEGIGEMSIPLAKKDKFVHFELSQAKINYEVRSKVANLQLDQHPIVMVASGLIKSTSHRFVKASLAVKGESIDRFNSKLFVLKAIVPTGTKGKIKVKLTADLPKGVEIVRLEPEEIEVVVD